MKASSKRKKTPARDTAKKRPRISSASAATAVPAPAQRTPKTTKGTRIPKGLTDPLFIRIPTLEHLQIYAAISGKLGRNTDRSLIKDNAEWTRLIDEEFEVSSTAFVLSLYCLYTAFSQCSHCVWTVCALYLYCVCTVLCTSVEKG